MLKLYALTDYLATPRSTLVNRNYSESVNLE